MYPLLEGNEYTVLLLPSVADDLDNLPFHDILAMSIEYS